MTDALDTRELELKFRLGRGGIRAFKKAVQLAAGAKKTWVRNRLVSRYFDTDDHRLAARSVSLRVRSTAGGFVQTLKAAKTTGGGLMDRSEWETPVATNELDIDELPPEARRALGVVVAGELVPMIDVDFERQTVVVERTNPLGTDLKVEIAIDTGVVKAAGRSERFAECEFELLQGDVSRFLDLAGEIIAKHPMPLSGVTKSDRGYLLLAGNGTRVHWVPKFRLTGDLTIHDALASIFSTCVGNIVDNIEACLDGRDAEAVHQMRVSLRRLRSSLRVFRRSLDPAVARWMNEDLKWLGGALGPAREWDVYIGETIGPGAKLEIEEPALAALRAKAGDRRSQAYADVRDTLNSERFARLVLRLTAFTTLQGWLPRPLDLRTPMLKPLGKTAAKLLDKPYQKLISFAQGLEDKDIDARHEVRIFLKKFRYPVDFFRDVYPGAATNDFVSALHNLQGQFGHLNDIAQAMELTESLARDDGDGPAGDLVQFAAGQVRGWYAREMRDAESRLITGWEAFSKMPIFWQR